ncbi:hypothetical protein GCM10012290_23600 [Halolactibacillus alkaliphilus]|nr:hypothetical protein GCM10012290_23600 [Halolactibacillus alkaliphilus]
MAECLSISNLRINSGTTMEKFTQNPYHYILLLLYYYLNNTIICKIKNRRD